MGLLTFRFMWPIILPIVFFLLSLKLFNKINKTVNIVIDEEFHLRQGELFCKRIFDVWNPKITTFPGLYMITSLIWSTWDHCTTYHLRLTSLLASTFNVFLVIKIKESLGSAKGLRILLESINLSILPPMYFFSHLYYTDILSITSVLTFFYLALMKKHMLASFFGVVCVLMRQTNIVWVAMVLGQGSINTVYYQYAKEKKVNFVKVIKHWWSKKNLKGIMQRPKVIKQSLKIIFKKYYGYCVILCGFIAFVAGNGSIVIGDKSAHVAQLHIPQIMYFSLFTIVFAIAPLCSYWLDVVKSMITNRKLTMSLIAIGLLIVNCNTLVHPYLLADNRHYTFYIWNRLYGKYEWFKYAMVPVYVFGLYFIQIILRTHQDLCNPFQFMFWISTFAVLTFQKLLEMRYFLIPFVILRLMNRRSNIGPLLFEFIIYMIINFIAFYIFLTKEIFWTNFDEPQRLIW